MHKSLTRAVLLSKIDELLFQIIALRDDIEDYSVDDEFHCDIKADIHIWRTANDESKTE